MFFPPEPFEVYKKLPKCNLHTHLEGSIRPETFLDLACLQNVNLPFDPSEVHEQLQVSGEESNLVDYLDKIMVNYQILKNQKALRRTSFEAAEDAHKDGVIYFELRAGPVTHSNQGLSVEVCIESILAGLKLAEEKFGIVCRLIIAGLRDHNPKLNEKLARISIRYLDQGVVGFDLAGDEAGYPASLHKRAFEVITDSGLGITVHAGEASGWESVLHAVEDIGARRIGHGVRSIESPDVMDLLREKQVLLEICPTSNVHTKAVPSIASHPVKLIYESGIPISIGDDDPITSRTRVSNELTLLDQELGFTLEQLVEVQLMSVKNSFLRGEDIKNRLKSKIQDFTSEQFNRSS